MHAVLTTAAVKGERLYDDVTFAEPDTRREITSGDFISD
jgi:hypothetical protein